MSEKASTQLTKSEDTREPRMWSGLFNMGMPKDIHLSVYYRVRIAFREPPTMFHKSVPRQVLYIFPQKVTVKYYFRFLPSQNFQSLKVGFNHWK